MKGSEDDRVFLRMRLDGKGAVNISRMSGHEWEKEVLIPAGSKFRVTKPRQEAYFNKITDRILFASDLSDSQKAEIGQDAKEKENKRVWSKFWMMEVEEVAGPGEAQRVRNNEGRAKRMEARRRLLQARQAG